MTKKKALRSGSVEYTARGFYQDAMEAMRQDVVRGLIELITNSDDAYDDLDDGKTTRKIVVEVEHRKKQPWLIVVRDRALGMSAETMEQRITRLAERTSGFERGKERRGYLGRGAKDVAAFGETTFASIHDGKYAELVLQPNGDWKLVANRKATMSDREELGIPRGSGTVVTIQARANVRCPHHSTLKQKLSSHFQLRDILSDPQRRVELVNLNDGSRDLLTYSYPELEVAFDGELDVPGYEDASPHLTIWRLDKRYDDGPDDMGRPNGILIKGRRAIYDNTLFKYERDAHSGWFAGVLSCPYVDALAQEHADRFEKGELTDPVIRRGRDGLYTSHPFVAALRKAVEAPLGELVAQEAEKARRSGDDLESDDTRAALDRLSKEVARLITQELRDIEAEELPGDLAGGPPLLTIVPEIAYAYIGENKTLTVAAKNEGIAIGEEVAIEVDPTGVVELLTPTVVLGQHRRRDDLLVGQIQVRPMLENESTIVGARLGDRTAAAMIEVRPEREEVEEEIEPPEEFEFERPSYQVALHRGKNLQVIAPASVVAEQGRSVQASCPDPGIVVRTPNVELEYDDEVDFYRATIAIEGRTLGAADEVIAKLDNLSTSVPVKVTRKEEGPRFKIRLIAEDLGAYRGTIEAETTDSGHEIQVIKVWARHPAIRGYLGDDFSGQNTPLCRAVIAEVVADVSARYVVEKLYEIRRTSEEFDTYRTYREHYKRLLRFLPRFQRILVGDPRAARTAEALEPVALLEAAQPGASEAAVASEDTVQ